MDAPLQSVEIIETQVRAELGKQNRKWGKQDHHPLYWLGIIMEELGEAAKACIEWNEEGYKSELIQLAACCVAALESLDRGHGLGAK